MKEIFENAGGKFIISEGEFKSKLNLIKAFVFDWDGVFTTGTKDHELQSSFNEIDSMGTNLLRFAYYLKYKKLPFTSIISGENNKSAFTFVKRECFHSAYFKVSNKIEAAEHFCKINSVSMHEIAFVFDDVLDLSIAEKCGLRILIPRKANPSFNNYILKNNLTDYITGATSGMYAVRESCELLMSVYDFYDEAIHNRVAFTDTYKEYLSSRKSVSPQFFTSENEVIKESEV